MAYESLDDFIPEPGLHPALAGLAWLRGVWTGTANRQMPGEDQPREVSQRIEFVTNGGPYLFYLSQIWELEDGESGAALGMETGFWRADENANVEAVLTTSEGVAEVWYGKLQVRKIELVTDAVARSQHAEIPVTGGQRLYGLVDGDLWYSADRSSEGASLQPYLWGHLRREE